MARIVLVRHGESQATIDRVIGGPRTCAGLTDLGRRQSAALAERWRAEGMRCAELIASQYDRAQQTAEVLAPVLGVAMTVDPAFGEIDPGPDDDGLAYDTFFATRHRTATDWDAMGPFGHYFAGGETVSDLFNRVGKGLEVVVGRLDRIGPQATAVICCHGGVIDAALRRAMQAPLMGSFALFTTNCSITEVWSGPTWRVVRYNDAAHLSGLKGDSP